MVAKILEAPFKTMVGKNLRDIREREMGLDQRTFAEKAEAAQQTVSGYERGQIPRSWLFLARLREMGIDLNRLFGTAPGDTNGGGR